MGSHDRQGSVFSSGFLIRIIVASQRYRIMAAWTPIVFDLFEYSSSLYNFMEGSLDQLWSQPGSLSRSKISGWKISMTEQFQGRKDTGELVRNSSFLNNRSIYLTS